MRANEAHTSLRRERLTWNEICARYPDEWVVLVELERDDDTDLRFHAAVVLAHHKTRKAASQDVKTAFERYEEAGSFFTGRLVHRSSSDWHREVTCFSPDDDLIIVDCRVWGPQSRHRRPVRLVLDTGATTTVMVPEVIDELGYNPRDGESITVMRSAVGREQGYLLRVARLEGWGTNRATFAFMFTICRMAGESKG